MELLFSLPQLYIVAICMILLAIVSIFMKNKIVELILIFASIACFIYLIIFGILYGLSFDTLVIIGAIVCMIYGCGFIKLKEGK